jgi:hypothetical protein
MYDNYYDNGEEEYTLLEEDLIYRIYKLEEQIAALEHENYELRDKLDSIRSLNRGGKL